MSGRKKCASLCAHGSVDYTSCQKADCAAMYIAYSCIIPGTMYKYHTRIRIIPGIRYTAYTHPIPHGFWFSTLHLFTLDLGFAAVEKRCVVLRAKQYQARCSISCFRDTACASLAVLPCRTPYAVVAVGVRSTVVFFCKCISTDASANLFQTMPTLAELCVQTAPPMKQKLTHEGRTLPYPLAA